LHGLKHKKKEKKKKGMLKMRYAKERGKNKKAAGKKTGDYGPKKKKEGRSRSTRKGKNTKGMEVVQSTAGERKRIPPHKTRGGEKKRIISPKLEGGGRKGFSERGRKRVPVFIGGKEESPSPKGEKILEKKKNGSNCPSLCREKKKTPQRC